MAFLVLKKKKKDKKKKRLPIALKVLYYILLQVEMGTSWVNKYLPHTIR